MRFAVYFAPRRDHPLRDAGTRWLGRDPALGLPLTPPARAQVRTPWRYGFHATLKAPMSLRTGCEEADLRARMQAVAARHPAFALPPLQVAWLHDFIALRPVEAVEPGHPLRRLADDCVRDLDDLREPLSVQEAARQTRPGFSERQRRQVQQYGYGHVFEDWRFHMTLSDDLGHHDPDLRTPLFEAAFRHFEDALQAPLECDRLSLFVEEAPGTPFTCTWHAPLPR